MEKLKNIIKKFTVNFNEFIQNSFSDKKKTFKLLAIIVFSILFLIEVGIILINNSFYTNFSDDLLQYYTIMNDFISSLKDGSLSWFNLNNYLGASFFSDIYYIPLDIFTLITFLISYLMPIEIAYSITELIKIFAGVMVFAYYLSLKNYKNRTIFWMSIIYFVSGGTVSYMAFPVFLSLTFYLPLSLVVIHYFMNKKRWLVPLFSLAIIFYDFYLGYTLLAFICFAFLIKYFKKKDFKFRSLIKDGIIFVSLLLIGVVMAAVIMYPSIRYILDETYRVSGNFDSWQIYTGSVQLNLFKPGLDLNYLLELLVNNTFFGGNMDSTNTVSNLVFNGFRINLFQPEIYIRYLAKIFVEQKPIGFYGFKNNYGLEHISLYITIIGFAYMCNIFFMKDRISKIYKYTVLFAMIFMFFPIFSYVFSGTLDVPYTRWINMLPIIEVLILAHVFENNGFEKPKIRNMIIIVTSLLALGGFLIFYYIKKLALDTNYYSRDVLRADTIFMGVALGILVLFIIFFILKKFTIIKWIFWIEFIIAIGYIYSGPFSIANKIDTYRSMHSINTFLEDSLSDDTQFYRVYVDVDNFDTQVINFNRMTTYPTNTDIFHSWTDAETNEISRLLFDAKEYQSKSKMNYFGYYISNFLGYKYLLVNSNSGFDFDEKYFSLVKTDGIYQLYQINGVTPFKVYDSYLLYGTFNTFCRSDSNLAAQKVLLTSAITARQNEDGSDRYDITKYNLDQGATSSDVTDGKIDMAYTISPNSIVTADSLDGSEQKEYYVYNQDTLNVKFNVGAFYIKMPTYSMLNGGANIATKTYNYYANVTVSVGQYVWVKFPNIVLNNLSEDSYKLRVSFDNRNNYYDVLLDGETVNPLDFSGKLVRLEFNGNNFIANTSMSSYGESYVLFADGTKQSCQFFEDQEFQIKCEFWKQPVALYIEKNDTVNSRDLELRSERAIDSAAYLVFDLSKENFSSTSGVIQFSTSPTYDFEKVFVTDDQGNEYGCLDGFLNYSNVNLDKIYIYKTGDMYKNSSLFTMKLKYSYDDLSDSDALFNNSSIENQMLTISKGKIDLSYSNKETTTKDQIVMIPVAYSDEWIITNGFDYDTISVSGGFLGIVIPEGSKDVNLELKFKPNGLDKGLYASLIGLAVYLAIFMPGWIKNRKKVSEMNADETS